MKSIKLISLVILLQLSLCSCINVKKILGFDLSTINFPPGDYIGTAKQIHNGETLDAAYPVKVTFLPKEIELQDGIGVLVMRNDSQRFFWRTDGNNVNSWNVLFHKDQNLYTNMQESFKFDGLITSSTTANKLEGRLHFNNHQNTSDYFIQAAQTFPPEIIPGKEALEIKAGDDIVISVAKIGENQDAIQVLVKANDSKKDPKPMAISKIDRGDKGTTITLATDKKMKKAVYSLYLLRDSKVKSNSTSFEIK